LKLSFSQRFILFKFVKAFGVKQSKFKGYKVLMGNIAGSEMGTKNTYKNGK